MNHISAVDTPHMDKQCCHVVSAVTHLVHMQMDNCVVYVRGLFERLFITAWVTP